MIVDGGYSAETCFHTSYEWGTKYQEVNLLDHFTAEYIDTSPDIQVSIRNILTPAPDISDEYREYIDTAPDIQVSIHV